MTDAQRRYRTHLLQHELADVVGDRNKKMPAPLLRRADSSDISRLRRSPVDGKARAVAEPIVDAIRNEGEAALRRYAVQFGELKEGGKLLFTRDEEYHRMVSIRPPLVGWPAA